MTLTEGVQDAPGARLAPENVTDEDPAAAIIAALLPHVVGKLAPLGVATTSPAGKLSVNEIPFSVEFVFGLLIPKLKLVVPLSGTEVAPKLLVIEGGLITISVADEVFPLPASLESIVTLLL